MAEKTAAFPGPGGNLTGFSQRTHVTGLLVSHTFNTKFGKDLVACAATHGSDLELLVLPADPEARMADSAVARAELALFSQDIFPDFSRQFFSATRKAPRLKWLHVFNAGVDHPIYASILERGVRLTTSSGATAEPIAQTAITGMLMLARGFPRWLAAQQQHHWSRMTPGEFPPDLRGQVMLIYGMGKIGREIARLARLLGLRVVGVRRSGAPCDEADELHTPDQLAALLPQCDWLVLACPLTDETRGIIDAAMLAQLPRGAYVINICRGEVVDENALIGALDSGHLGGAYLDVFAEEPLPPHSPLWLMPNVFVTPHNSAAAAGNQARVNAIFLDNLRRWQHQEPLVNEITTI